MVMAATGESREPVIVAAPAADLWPHAPAIVQGELIAMDHRAGWVLCLS